MANFASHFYFSFRGRTGRSAYWLFGVVPGIVLGMLFGFLAASAGASRGGFLLLLGLLTPLFLWMWLAIGVRRLHDMNLSGWWMAAVLVAPVAVSFLFPEQLQQLPSLFTMIVLGVVPGTLGSNEFGSNPNIKTTADDSAVDVRANKSLERTREG